MEMVMDDNDDNAKLNNDDDVNEWEMDFDFNLWSIVAWACTNEHDFRMIFRWQWW